MRLKKFYLVLLFSGYFFASCSGDNRTTEQAYTGLPDSTFISVNEIPKNADTFPVTALPSDTAHPVTINTGQVSPENLLSFARTLIGVPYKYASTDPAEGFDCSGFITYVFNHFKIKVPRSSIDFTNAGKEISADEALPGDLILFTGTDSTQRFVGHMGIISERTPDSTFFIHSTSGKAFGVTITPFNSYYKSRFVKVIRIFHSI